MNVKKKIAFFMSLALLASASAAVVTQSPDLLGLDSLFSLTATAADSGTCGDSTTWAFADGVLTISGTGAVDRYNSLKEIPWYDYLKSIKTVVIGKDVTYIDITLFDSCVALTSFSAEAGSQHYVSENGVFYNYAKTALYHYARYNTDSVFVIPSTVKEVANYAFYKTKLTEIHVPISVNKVGKEAFESGGETPLKMYFADYPSYIGKNGYGTNTELYIGGEAAVKDYTMSDYFDYTDVTVIPHDTLTGWDIPWVYFSFEGLSEKDRYYEGIGNFEIPINRGDTIEIDTDWKLSTGDYTPADKVFYAIIPSQASGVDNPSGHMLYMTDTLAYPEDISAEWFSTNPFFAIDKDAKSFDVGVYERSAPNILMLINTGSMGIERLGAADDAALKRLLNGREFVMFKGETWTIPEILGKAGVAHIATCLAGDHVYNSSLYSNTPNTAGENVISFEPGNYEHRVTALAGGTAQVEFDAYTDRCVFHSTATAEDNILTIRVIDHPDVVATETTLAFEKIDGCDYSLMGTIAPDEITDTQVIFKNLTPGKSYPVLLKMGDAQTSFEVQTDAHNELLRVKSGDISTAELICTNPEKGETDCHYVASSVTIQPNKPGEVNCDEPAVIVKSENLPADVEISAIRFYATDDPTLTTPLTLNELENGQYIAAADVTRATPL